MSNDEIPVDVQKMLSPLFEAHGRALSALSQIEACLSMIFARCMQGADQETSYIAFDAIQLTSPKIRVLRAVAKHHFSRELLDPTGHFERLNKILKRIEARTEFRTKLAHWIGSTLHVEDLFNNISNTKYELRLVPPWNSKKNLNFIPTETISITDIELFTHKCYVICNDLIRFNLKLGGINILESMLNNDAVSA